VPAVGGLFLVYGRSLAPELHANSPMLGGDANAQAAVRSAPSPEEPPGLRLESRPCAARPRVQRAHVA
jgi:hypothetical protein